MYMTFRMCFNITSLLIVYRFCLNSTYVTKCQLISNFNYQTYTFLNFGSVSNLLFIVCINHHSSYDDTVRFSSCWYLPSILIIQLLSKWQILFLILLISEFLLSVYCIFSLRISTST